MNPEQSSQFAGLEVQKLSGEIAVQKTNQSIIP